MNDQNARDCISIAIAFTMMQAAATSINLILEHNKVLNETTPKDWPLPRSADEMAMEFNEMRDLYLAKAIDYQQKAIKEAGSGER